MKGGIRRISCLYIVCVCGAFVVAASAAPPNVVERWENAAAQGVKDAKMGAPMEARALAIVHTCMYDAWAAYDEHAVGTQLRGALRRPASEGEEARNQPHPLQNAQRMGYPPLSARLWQKRKTLA